MISNRHLIGIALIFLMGSCSKDFLDVAPKDQLSDATFWKTENDADLALVGAYGTQTTDAFPNFFDWNEKSSSWESSWNINFMDLMTDNGYSQFIWDGVQTSGNGQVNPSDRNMHNFFKYDRITKYNTFLENIDRVEMDAEKRSRYKAEVRFLRAYDYFKKVMWYGDVPLVTASIADPQEANLTRDPKEEVVAFILSELGEIAPDLPVQDAIESGGHATRGAALALKARLELYEEMYPEAMVDAKAVIDMGVYELYQDGPTAYYDMFLSKNEGVNKEVIMAVQHIQNEFPSSVMQHLLSGEDGGWSSINAVQSIVDAYETIDGKTIDDPSSVYDPDKPFENRDPRLSMTVRHAGVEWSGGFFDPFNSESNDFHAVAVGPNSGYGVNKYAEIVPTADLLNGDVNVVVFRLGEMLLTYAEAAIESNQINDDVYDALDRLRVRAGMPVVDRAVYDSQEKLRELVRRERRVELAFEGLRHYDIKRWDIGDQVIPGPLYGSRTGSVNPVSGEVTLDDESTRIILEERVFLPSRNYLLPIPQAEIDANPNMVQNPGY
ncbi:RagB/SusD family nutrient uptake outer membrane protein [Zobellia russellii]|uniref:RagB/SusD family nutrient uptake outer membrane protein n=1 Tax=Zobellia russellii TaxID=248907 RepID=UPI001BFF2CE3|nr:RagB/SusD family nutrient uptake outer membrane protein [Zobellia russellii]MBT9189517.1 RagB/SusD family nutrient uptake outer membrane protein [Zobellia russellii]